MLTFLRDGAKSGPLKYGLIGFMGLAVLSLVFIDMNGSFREGIGSNAIAKIGDSEFSAYEFRDQLQRAEQQSGIPEIPQALRTQLAYQVVDSEIRRRVFALEAQDLGLIVPDAVAAREIKRQLQPLVDNGFTAQEALAQQLRSLGMSEAQFINVFKQDMSLRLLLDALTRPSYAPAEMLNASYKYENQSRNFDVIKIDLDRFDKEIPDVTDEALEKFYTANVKSYLTPEYREISYFSFNESDLTTITLTEDDVKQIYEDNIYDYTLPAHRVTDQIVFSSADLAQKVLGDAETPTDLMASLKENASSKDYVLLSDEPVSEDDALEIMVDSAFDTPIGAITGPFETPLGWVLMVVKSEQAEQEQAFDTVKDEIKTTYEREANDNKLYDTANKIDDMLASGLNVSDIAAELDFDIFQTPFMSFDGKTPDQKSAEILQKPYGATLLKNTFELEGEDTAPLMEAEDGTFVAYTISNRQAPAPKALNDIKETIIADWKKSEKTQKLLAFTQAQHTAVEEGQSLSDLKKSQKLSLKSYKDINAQKLSEQPQDLQPLIREAFALKAIDDSTTFFGKDASYIIQLRDITYPTTGIPKDTAKEYKQAIQERIRTDLMTQFERSLREKYDVEINTHAIQRAITPQDDLL